MTIPSVFANPWRSMRRRAHSVFGRLRGRLPTCFLALLFGLSLSEPLLCVIHCQIWLPIAYRNYHAAMHHDHHTRAIAQSGFARAAATVGTSSTSMPQCTSFGPAGSQIPFYVPPSPVHDLAPALLSVAIILLMLAIALPARPPLAPPQLAPPRLLRPPKLTFA